MGCPPYKYRMPRSSKNHIYQNGDLPAPSIGVLERHKVHSNSNFIVIYRKEAQVGTEIRTWLHRNGFILTNCFFHTFAPLGENHDTHMCIFEKYIKQLQF